MEELKAGVVTVNISNDCCVRGPGWLFCIEMQARVLYCFVVEFRGGCLIY